MGYPFAPFVGAAAAMPHYLAVIKQKDSTMKKANEYTQKDVARRGFGLIYSADNILLRRRPKMDKRYNFSNDVLTFVKNHQLSEAERLAILATKKQRAKNRPQNPVTLFQLPLLKDYMSNKSDIRQVLPDRLVFIGGRNHWAKNEQDRRILSILIKNRK